MKKEEAAGEEERKRMRSERKKGIRRREQEEEEWREQRGNLMKEKTVEKEGAGEDKQKRGGVWGFRGVFSFCCSLRCRGVFGDVAPTRQRLATKAAGGCRRRPTLGPNYLRHGKFPPFEGQMIN